MNCVSRSLRPETTIKVGWGVRRTVTIGMRDFGRGSVWNVGWFWIEVQGLVFIVGEDECRSVDQAFGSLASLSP